MNHRHTSLRRTLLASALVLAFAGAGSASAQTTAGSVAGKAASGSTIVIENKSIGLSRQVTVGNEGSYAVSQLPPGDYVVRIKYPDGTTEDRKLAVVRAGSARAAGSQGRARRSKGGCARCTRVVRHRSVAG